MKKEIDLNAIVVNFSASFSLDTRKRYIDDLEDLENVKNFTGELEMIDIDGNDKMVGSFTFSLFTGCENNILKALDWKSVETAPYYTEFTETKRNLIAFEDIYATTFGNCRLLIIDNIELVEHYRGYGVVKHLINNLDRMFDCPMALIPFPLQHSYKEDKIKDEVQLNHDMKKLKKAYKKCGFFNFSKNGSVMLRHAGEID